MSGLPKIDQVTISATLCVALLTLQSCTKEVQEVAGCNFISKTNLTLMLDEEFDTDIIDTTATWTFMTGKCRDTTITVIGPDTIKECFWDDREQQLFTNRIENARIDSGNLKLIGRFENPPFQENNFTSARLTTKNKFTLNSGLIEVRAIVPSGEGLWPSIFLMPTREENNIFDLAELGAMRSNGINTSEVLSYISYADTSGEQTSIDYQFSFPENDSVDFSADYHIYTLQWNSDCIQFFVDDVPVDVPATRSSILPASWILDQNYFLVLDFALGGNGGANVPFSVLNPFSSPSQEFIIDYVKIYQ